MRSVERFIPGRSCSDPAGLSLEVESPTGFDGERRNMMDLDATVASHGGRGTPSEGDWHPREESYDG